MTFDAAERAYLAPPEPCCDREDCDGVRCWEEAADRAENARIEKADAIRKGEW